ncbi:MAG: 6-carboxytetrahydropterin synthase QueD [Bacteroidetes bacterium HGW-Bacteroidetes-1]|jgi:6-pyruvoyltetrahydropterin/6-carboxytetrahydropterin synthase|nr:MAG: 6-carboxytetrahydropterin synthase QueD [Bacteroidetes bacterium HGW-Bacteroidetes-1]
MAKIRITKEFKFEMAHALLGYDGPCRNVHGHSYELEITAIGEPITDKKHVKLGMVMDFGDLKRVVMRKIINVFDHALVLNNEMSTEITNQLRQNFDKVILLNYQPTSELMVIDFAEKIASELPDGVKLIRVMLRETATSFAEWIAADQI